MHSINNFTRWHVHRRPKTNAEVRFPHSKREYFQRTIFSFLDHKAEFLTKMSTDLSFVTKFLVNSNSKSEKKAADTLQWVRFIYKEKCYISIENTKLNG